MDELVSTVRSLVSIPEKIDNSMSVVVDST